MKYRISVSPEAKNDLLKIREYISVDLGNPKAASRTVNSILDRIKQLSDTPEIGAPSLVKDRYGYQLPLSRLRELLCFLQNRRRIR